MLIAVFVSILGFNVDFPFLPLYVQQLGVTDARQAAFWSGVIGSIAGLLAAVIAPVWGHMADRRGRKPMLVRATAGAAVGLVVMGLAPTLMVLLAGRIAFGLMAGTVPAANPLIAANTPAEHIGSAMGMLQSSLYVSNAVGPLVGGVLAGAVGYRVTFIITALLYVVSAVPVILLVRERFTPPEEDKPLVTSLTGNFRMVFGRRDLLVPIFAAFLAYSGVSALQPVLPLHISNLVDGSHVARATGIAAGLQGAAGTIAAFSVGRVTRRLGYGPVLVWSPPLLIAAYLGLRLVHSYVMLLAMLAVVGVIQGLAVTSLTALIALRAPRESASAFGLRAVFPFSALLAAGMLALCLRVAPREHGRAQSLLRQ